MTFRLVDRVRETAISPGTGTAVLAGAALGYQTFSAGVGANNTTYYVIADQSGANWEVGYGTVGALGTTLARTTVLSSSNAGALVNFSSGTQDVWVDYPATKAVWLDINGDISQAIRNISGITGAITAPESITFDLAPSVVPTAPGSLYWDAADGNQTLSLVMANGDAIQQIGEEQYFRIKASAPITEGQVVMFTGTVGASGGLTGAPATGLTAATASYVMGIATHNLATNDWGYVTSFGLVRGINTTGGAEAWVDGQILYLDPTVAGGLTKTLPTAPNPKVQVCAVIYAASNGSLFVRSTFGGILGQYEGDVQITSPANGNLLVRNQTTGAWVNALLGAGTGFSVTNGAGSVSVGASVAAIGTWMGTPSSANLLAAMTDETGTGSLVFATSPTLVTPLLGTPTSGNLSNCTNIPAGQLTGTIPSGVLGNSTLYVGTTAIALNRASANLALTGLLSGTFQGSTSGSVQLIPAAAAGTGTVLTMPATTGTIITSGDSATVTNTMLAGSIANAKLLNSSVTFNGVSVALGASGTITATATNALTISSPLSGTSYNGSAAASIGLAAGYGDTQNPYASKTANYFLAAPNGSAGAPTFRAIVAADIPTLNQNTTGTASNVTGTVAIGNGGTGATTAAAARTNLGATTVGSNFFTLTNPSAITFPRINADNTVSALDAATFRSAIGAGTGTGTVTSVSGTGSASGLSLSGTVTTSGNITLSGTVNALAAGTYGISITGNAATSTTSVGYGQSWQDVSGSRAAYTTYTNSSGKPIMVTVACQDYRDGQNGWGTAYVDGVAVGRSGGYTDGYTKTTSMAFIVQNGSTYRVDPYESGYDIVSLWRELR